MNDFLSKVNNAKHVMIEVDVESLAAASALYTQILRLHKKVSLVCKTKNIDKKLSFLPWFDKIRSTEIKSADLIIKFNYSILKLCDFFKYNKIKINSKMATALYAGLLQETNGFLNSKADGISFALAKELIDSGAEYKICNKFILNTTTLAFLRLKALMFKNMLLQNDAKAAVFYISLDDLKSTGSTLENCNEILLGSLKLSSVEIAVLLSIDKNYEVLKLIYKEI